MIPKTHPNFDALDLLSILRPGTTRREFEEAMAVKAGAQYGLAFAYGHAGFFALLKALNLSQAEILVPAYTCKIMLDVIVTTGNIPVFVDIDLADYNMDLSALKSAITTKTKAIIATHMFGYPTSIKTIREIANNEQIIIVEDAALTFPGSTLGRNGLQGDVGLFSFGPAKPLFTLRGGVIVTNNSKLYEKLESYRDREMSYLSSKEWAKRWALLVVHYLLSRNSIYSLTWRLNLSKGTIHNLAWRLRPVKGGHRSSTLSLPGDYATRYTDLQARIGLTQLRKSDFVLSQRRAIAKLYDEALQDIPGLAPAPMVEGASYSLYTVRVKDRDLVCFGQKMRAKGIETGHTFNYAVSNLEEHRPYARGIYPCAEQTGREAVNLPIYTGLMEGQIQDIACSARQILQDRVKRSGNMIY
jgi:perosamine synthetase